jgi:ligand-binding sensor domain-containing protein
MRLTPLVLLTALVAAPAHIEAAETLPPVAPQALSQYVHHTWRRGDGLPQDSVNAVLQTRDGFLWLGTQEGLVRFDGVRFILFNKANTPAFTHNDVGGLAEGPDGSLWIGTYGGLLQYKAGQFTAHPSRHSRERDVIMSLAVDRLGAVWMGTQNAGVNRFENGRFDFFSAGRELAGNAVSDVAVDREGNVWVATSAGLSVRRGTTWTTFGRAAGMPDAVVWRVLPARDGSVWLGTSRGFARVVSGVVRAPQQPQELAAAVVRSLAEDRDGALWIGTDAGVAWRYAAGAASSLVLSDQPKGNTVLSVTEDREGNVWIGTYAAGLHRLWRGRFSSLAHRHGLAEDDVRAVLQARNGDVWISTEAAGLCRFDGTAVTTYTTRDGLPSDVARALFEDRQGTLFVGTRNGLCRFEGGRFRTVPGTEAVSIRALAEDDSGTLWVGGATAGVFRLVGGRLVDVGEDGRTRLPGGVVRSVVRDHAGAMWIGTNDALTRWDHGRPTVLTTKDGLPSDPIYCIHEDADHTYWLGSYGGGLVRIKGARVTRYTQAVGLFDEVVYQVLEDRAGHLWISCNNGVYRVTKSQLNDFADGKVSRITSEAFDSADGMLSSECNGNTQPAGWATRDGRLWFPTTGGVAIIDPADLRMNTLAPLVAIEKVVANRTPFPADDAAIVPPGAGQVEFEYTGLSFIAPQKVRFRYRLEGMEADWVDAGERRQTNYTNLAPGRYVFHVMACNNDGVWSQADARFAFELRPHFYQADWFRALYWLAGIGAVLGAMRLRVWQHVRRERELSRRVDQALGRIKTLSGLIPICSHCKKIRDDRGYWNQLEQFLKAHSEATFSHGICPDCMSTLYPDDAHEPDRDGER